MNAIASKPAPQKQLQARRRFINLLGGGVVTAAVPLAAGCSLTPPPATIKAWLPLKEKDDVRQFMLAHALLAPNPHNRQPWLADLRRSNEITLVCDKDRLLPETDPFGRQILIGCGAFIELAVIAAAERGMRVSVQTFPNGMPASTQLPGGSTFARLLLIPDATLAYDLLFAQIQRRHTNKGEYDNARPVSPELLRQFIAPALEFGLLAGEVMDDKRKALIRELTRASYETEMLTQRTWLESANLLRIGPNEIEKHRDGIAIMGTMPRIVNALGLFDRFATPVRGDSNFTRLMDRWAPFETGSGYCWIASRGNDRISQLNAGRAYVRAHLLATAAGIDMHPLSQALQEFAEVRAQFEALSRVLGVDPGTTTVQMLCRVGYGKTAAAPTPRRELQQIMTL